jgi:dissimilatory sulfite reductase (desulfoviridin) alpha/beta subunit
MTKAFNLNNGSILLVTEIDGGVYSPSHLRKIASICESKSMMIKTTEDQRLAIVAKAEQVNEITSELQSIGLDVRPYQEGLHKPISCIGAFCPDHDQDALGTAMEISSELIGIASQAPLKIGINGCAKCCTPCHTLDISIIGESSGYRIAIGGKNSQYPEFASLLAESVSPDETPTAVKTIVHTYLEHAQEGETFHETMERIGISQFTKALALDVLEEESRDQHVDIDSLETAELALSTNESLSEPELSANMPQADSTLKDIILSSDESTSTFDVPINLGHSGTMDISIQDLELVDQSSSTINIDENNLSEDAIEARLAEGISEIASTVEHVQSLLERDKHSELLSSASIDLNEAAQTDGSLDEEHLQSELVDISHRLTDLENGLKQNVTQKPPKEQLTPWELAGFDIDLTGNPVILWQNGIKTIIDCKNQKSGRIFVGKRTIKFAVLDSEVHVELDGISMVLPVAA